MKLFDYNQYRTPPQIGFMGMQPLLVDNFAGGGGASTGIQLALGRDVDIAINHDELALEMHKVNHPHTRHINESVWDVDIKKVTNGQPVGLGHFSPDCTHFSKAKGGKPIKKKIRGLANIAIRWAVQTDINLITLENVEEFKSWGPISKGKAIKELTGLNFEIFIKQLKALDFTVDYRTIVCADYGAPTSRKRLFLIARRDKQAIVWPKYTHSHRSLSGKNYLPSSTGIDWSIPCPSIFERKKQLVDNTCRRIAKGIHKFIIDCDEPFIVEDQAAFISKYRKESPGSSLHEPLHTITSAANHHYLVTAFLNKHYTGATGSDLSEPIGTITSIDHHSLTSACLIPIDHTGGKNTPCYSMEDPMTTVTSKQRHGLVYAFLVKFYGQMGDQSLHDPLHTIRTKDCFALVTIKGQQYAITDIGFRMLQPHELFINQGFPRDYIIDRDSTGKPLTKKKQTALCGNSVPPVVIKALIEANAPADLFLKRNKETA